MHGMGSVKVTILEHWRLGTGSKDLHTFDDPDLYDRI